MDTKAYDVMLYDGSDRVVGYKWGTEAGGLVYDAQGNVVGGIYRGVAHNEWILKADQPHHTGKRYDGKPVVWGNRPSRKFN